MSTPSKQLRSPDMEREKAPRAGRSSRVPSLNRELIEAKALSYLDKFDASTARLRRILTEFVRKHARELGIDASPHLHTVEETLHRYQQTGLLDDRRYSMTMAQNLVARGVSRQAIKARLFARGIAKDTVNDVLGSLASHAGSELEAALALVRKRRIGRYRAEAERRDNYRRDLGILARAGFDFDTARRALALEGVDDEDLF